MIQHRSDQYGLQSSLARSTWADSSIFGKPHGTEYDADATSDATVGNTDGVTTYFEHETGQDQIIVRTRSAITANIQSGDLMIFNTRWWDQI